MSSSIPNYLVVFDGGRSVSYAGGVSTPLTTPLFPTDRTSRSDETYFQFAVLSPSVHVLSSTDPDEEAQRAPHLHVGVAFLDQEDVAALRALSPPERVSRGVGFDSDGLSVSYDLRHKMASFDDQSSDDSEVRRVGAAGAQPKTIGFLLSCNSALVTVDGRPTDCEFSFPNKGCGTKVPVPFVVCRDPGTLVKLLDDAERTFDCVAYLRSRHPIPSHDDVIREYLVRRGYAGTLEAFCALAGQPSSPYDQGTLEKRSELRRRVVFDREPFHPSVQAESGSFCVSTLRLLHRQCVVELVAANRIQDAIEYARANRDCLDAALAFARPDDEALTSRGRRFELADAINLDLC